jgi:microcystin degradation protein MlrC
VLSAEINTETNTFSVLPTTLESYRARIYYRDAEIESAMGSTACEIAAHIDAAERHGWRLVQPIAARATPSGRTTADAWAHLSGAVIKACDQGPFDGVLLALHGAMVTEDQDDAEGDLLRRLRDRLGDAVPIAITLDLHANVSDEMAALANIILAYRTYPHIDHYEVATEAADLLEDAMAGRIRPCATVVRSNTVEGCNYGQTQGGPMVALLDKAALSVEADTGVLAVTVCAGFTHSDIAFAGPTVTVVGNGEDERYRAVADDLMVDIWATREEITVHTYAIVDGIAAAMAPSGVGAGPLVLADFTDNPGAGGYGDSVRLLQAMIEAGIGNAAFGVVADPTAVANCQAAGEGVEVTLSLGAKVDPAHYGPPITVTGIVERLSGGAYVCDGPQLTGEMHSMGPTAVLRIGGVRVVIATNNQQVTDRQVFLSQGIDPARCSVVALKSSHHFRAAFEPIAREVMLVDSGGLATRDLTKFDFRKIRRPVWPLDDV